MEVVEIGSQAGLGSNHGSAASKLYDLEVPSHLPILCYFYSSGSNS